MITLILAPPRTGKSQYAVSLGLKGKEQGKRVFVTNFNQTPEQRQESGFELFGDDGVWPVEGRTEFKGDISGWWEELPHGSIWIIDEVQQVIPQRSKDKPVQDWVKQLSLHGHHDLTIYLITQDGMQMDVTARRNCNFTHILSRPLGMNRANVYEYRGFQELPNDAWRRSQVLKNAESKKTFKYSDKYQRLYKSASAHDHIKRRLPKRLLLLPAAIIFVGWCMWFAWSRLKPEANVDAPSAVASAAGALIGAQAPSAAGNTALSTDDYINKWKPRVEGVPVSAPAYDGFEVKDYPRPVCWISGRTSRCKCVSQQGSKLAIDQPTCVRYVEDGYFDPYKDPNGPQQRQAVDVTQPGVYDFSGAGQSRAASSVTASGPIDQVAGYGGMANGQ